MESSSHILIQAHISTDPTCAELQQGPKCWVNSMTVWTASPTVLWSDTEWVIPYRRIKYQASPYLSPELVRPST